jgi:hypothetical protein
MFNPPAVTVQFSPPPVFNLKRRYCSILRGSTVQFWWRGCSVNSGAGVQWQRHMQVGDYWKEYIP